MMPGRKAATNLTAAETVRHVAKECGLAPLQNELLEAWLSCVFEPAASDVSTVLGAALVVAADLSSLRVSISTAVAGACSLSRQLLERCGVPVECRQEVDRLPSVAQECKSHKIDLWCSLMQIGSEMPKVDVGYAVRGRVEWSMADVWVPQSADQDALRQYCFEEPSLHGADPEERLPRSAAVAPAAVGASLLPGGDTDAARPRRRSLEFELSFDTPSKGLFFGVGFLHALEFPKPSEALLTALTRSKPSRCVVQTVMGDAGALEVVVGFSSTTKTAVKDVSRAIACEAKEEALDRIWDIAGSGYDSAAVLQIIANASGITPAVGFRLLVAR